MNSSTAKYRRSQHGLKNSALIIVAVLLLGAGGYLLLLSLGSVTYIPSSPKEWSAPVPQEAAQLKDNRLYIPKLKLNLTYASGSRSVLNDHIWHRFPERGDPEQGGNFILAGHRFEIGFTPGETKRKSPFYHINLLKPGDKIYADFNGTRYEYEIVKRFSVAPTQVEIEAESETSKMTLYTCTLKGEKDGREVIEARLSQENVDPAVPL
jgi:sortase A